MEGVCETGCGRWRRRRLRDVVINRKRPAQMVGGPIIHRWPAGYVSYSDDRSAEMAESAQSSHFDPPPLGGVGEDPLTMTATSLCSLGQNGSSGGICCGGWTARFGRRSFVVPLLLSRRLKLIHGHDDATNVTREFHGKNNKHDQPTNCAQVDRYSERERRERGRSGLHKRPNGRKRTS